MFDFKKAVPLLSSPRGDELFLQRPEYLGGNRVLPSPRGDELFHLTTFSTRRRKLSYRPLAGMNCFYHLQYIKWRKEVTVPSRG